VKKMRKELVDVYALLLKEEHQVTFIENEFLYQIFVRGDGDFEIRVFKEDESQENWLEFDGGCCEGNEHEAIEFMLGG